MAFVDISKYDGFYLLSDKDKRGSIYLQPSGGTTFPYLEILRNGSEKDNPITFSTKKGSKWNDLVYAGWPGFYVVSAKFYNALKGMNGTKFYPALVVNSKTRQINSSYFGLSATGRSGPIIRNWYTEKVVTEGFLPIRTGLYFALDTWDGSDFFIPESSALLIVTEKVKTIIEQERLTNVLLTKLSDLENYTL